jgi:hypothetical protein
LAPPARRANSELRIPLYPHQGAAMPVNRSTSAAGQLMGIDQPKISAMLAGQFRGYSVERLMRFLVALGHDVEIVVKTRKRGAAELRVA